MNKISIKKLISLPFRGQGVLFLLLFSFSLSAQNFPSGKSILDKIDNNMSSKNRTLTAKMEIESARGTRTIEFKSWSEGDKKSFTEYLAPARERGTKMLKLENQLWIYSPSTEGYADSGHMCVISLWVAICVRDLMNDTPMLERYKAEVTAERTVDGAMCWVVTYSHKGGCKLLYSKNLGGKDRKCASENGFVRQSGKL
jgi:outer membrane lipoprotein-sorting protein